MKKMICHFASVTLALLLVIGQMPFASMAADYTCIYMSNHSRYGSGMIEAGNYHSVFLNPDGTVFAVGSEKLSEYDNRSTRCDVWDWEDMVQVSAASHTVGLKADGTVIAVGVNR